MHICLHSLVAILIKEQSELTQLSTTLIFYPMFLDHGQTEEIGCTNTSEFKEQGGESLDIVEVH